ncbi:hypothetical protein [Streptomyces sp. NPDC002790]|uniref:hypothetical protein n=1 Tax=Streptomyces sp. NPDC002790 TaxID=3154431 RepID=UPI003321D82D
MHIRNVRVAAGALAVVAVLAVGGCSGGGDDDSGGSSDAAKDQSKGSGSGESDGAGKSTPSSGSSSAGPGSLKDTEGVWKASAGGKPVVLVVGENQAALTTADGHLCTGTLAGADKPTLALRCADGNTDRTKGAVESNDGSTMRISWDAGQKDTFKKSTSKGGELPTSLPSGLPTN